MNINELLVQSLLFEEESTTLDFKRDQYNFVGSTDTDKKGEILKDILAFANAWRRTDAFIIIGVKEQKGEKTVVGVAELLDDAQLQQFVNSKTQKPLSFSYQNVKFKGVDIAVIQIPVQERPFYIIKDYGKLKKNTVYIRRGSATDEATPDEIATMRLSTYAESPATAPKLSLSFHLPKHGNTQQLQVLPREKLDRAKVLATLDGLILRPEDLELVKKYSVELGSIKDRYPSGQEFPAFPVEKVTDFQEEIINAIRLATDDFEEFLNRYELESRSYNLFYNNFSKMLMESGIPPLHYSFINLQNTGTSPAEGIIAYIKGSSKIRFSVTEKLRKETIRIHQEVPEKVMKIISQAKKMELGIKEPFITMYERKHKRKYNSLLEYDPSRIATPTFPSSFSAPYECSIRDNTLKISVRDDVMHNHNYEVNAESFCLCPLLDLGETVDIEFEVHAKNLPRPCFGKLTIVGAHPLVEV